MLLSWQPTGCNVRSVMQIGRAQYQACFQAHYARNTHVGSLTPGSLRAKKAAYKQTCLNIPLCQAAAGDDSIPGSQPAAAELLLPNNAEQPSTPSVQQLRSNGQDGITEAAASAQQSSEHDQQEAGTAAGAAAAAAKSKHTGQPSGRRKINRAHVPRLLMGRELQRVWTLALPLMINNIAGYALSIIGAVFIGRLGALPLSASVLANSVYNCTGLSLAYGLSAGMETQCGQAYGAGAYKRVGVILQRALLVCWSVCIIVAIFWSQSHALLLRLGQQPDIAALASRYLIFCIPCLFLTTAIECIRKYLQSQRAVKPAMTVAAVTLAASPISFWLLVDKLQMGLDGAALAFIACQVATLLGLLGYVVYRAFRLQGKREQTWGGWSGEAFRDWPEYCSYGLPAAAMIALEWWAYEVIILLAGLLPNAEVALSTMGIMLNINAWMYMLPMGLGAAVNTSISNAMGAGHASTAHRAFVTGISSGAVLQACLCACLMAGGSQLVGIFTTDAAVISCCCQVLPLLALLMFFDGLNAVVSGVLRGSGRQMLGAGINALGYWVIGVPLAAYLAFQGGLGVHGFWIGVTAGACVQAVVLLAILFRWDWRKEVERVQQLLKDAAASGKIVPSYGH